MSNQISNDPNDISTNPLTQQKKIQTLTQCISSILGIQCNKLHQIICTHLRKCLQQFTLPRKISYIKKDNAIIDQYKKYPDLCSFMKITLQMVSQIYETKIILFSINPHGVLTGLIINQKGYQQQIKLARINYNYYQVKDSLYSNHSTSKQEPSNNTQNYKLFQPFQIDTLPPKFQPKSLETTLPKSYTHIPGSPIVTKHISLCDETPLPPQPVLQNSIKIPALIQPTKQFDQMSLQNIVDDQEVFNSQQQQQSSDPLKFVRQDLTQSLPLQKSLSQTSQKQQTTTPLQEQNNLHLATQEPQKQQGDNGVYYGYYSHHMYYPPHQFMMGQGQGQNSSINDNMYTNNFNNLTHSVSLSPGKNNTAKKLNSTLETNQNQRYTGRLKFLDQSKNFGFIIMDADQSDIFVHCDDLQKAGISKQKIKSYKQSEGVIRFSFKVMSYFGKYRESRKAVDLIILDVEHGMSSLYT